MRHSALRLTELGLSVFLTGICCLPAAAQQLISAKSGLIHYTEGDVKIGAQTAAPNNGVFQSLANGKELTTTEGRAEMLLGPGQFVRLNENTSVKMVSNKLEATRIDVVRGSILVEIVDIDKNAPVSIGSGANVIEVRKPGLYRVDAEGSRLRVYDGEAVVVGSGQTVTAKKGKEVSMGAVFAQNGFDATEGDEFSRWSQRRAGYVATANISGARDLYMNGQNWSANNWAFNPWYGMYTYVPSRRMFMSPFGFYYFSPEMAFNDMFWPYLGGGYGFYGMGFGYGYGSPFYGGYGYNGYGYGSGYGNGYGYGGGSGGGGRTNGPGYTTVGRGTAFGPRGTTPTFGNSGGGPSMIRGGAGPVRTGDYGGVSRGGGYSSGVGISHSGGGGVSYSGGGGHSSGTVSSGSSSSGSVAASTGGGASSGGASAGGRSK